MKSFRPVACALRGVFASDFRPLVEVAIVAQIRAPLRPTPNECLRADTDLFADGSRGWNSPSLILKAVRAATNPAGDWFSGNPQVDPRLCMNFARIDRALRAGAAEPKEAASARAAAFAMRPPTGVFSFATSRSEIRLFPQSCRFQKPANGFPN
jgi:hypothetical protein